MAIDLAALKTELTTDPNTYGYAAKIAAGDTSGLADLLNEVRAAIQVNKPTALASEVYEQLDLAEFNALTAGDKADIDRLLAMGEIQLDGANARATFNAVFGPATATRANMQAFLTRNGSRAEELFGFGEGVTRRDVGLALALE